MRFLSELQEEQMLLGFFYGTFCLLCISSDLGFIAELLSQEP